MNRIPQYFVALVIFAFALTACETLGIAQPQTFNDKVAVAYGAVTQARTTTTQLLEAKKISADDAQNVLTTTDVARVGIDTARKMHTADPKGADSKLNAIRTGLTALIGYLATRGG